MTSALRRDESLEGLPRVAAGVHRLLRVGAEGREALGDELAHERLLVREVAVDRPHPDAGGAGDVVHLRLGPWRAEDLARGLRIRSRLRRASARSGRVEWVEVGPTSVTVSDSG
jgi:hypothetical protein